MNNRRQLIAWLNDAYSMERSLSQVLDNHVSDAKDHPELQSKLGAHLAETKEHIRQVERCLELLGEKPSVVKDVFGRVMGTVEGAATGMFRDELVKNLLADYSAEHFEIAAYQSLVAAAEQLGLPEIRTICAGILEQEGAMAAWLATQIPSETRRYLLAQAATN